MDIAADIAVGLVAALHLVFLILEMFLWKTPVGRRIFGMSPELVEGAAPLAANQGLYNGFLAAGLVWGLLSGPCGFQIKIFFLLCVVVAGIFGAATAKRSILWIQAFPGAAALILVILTG